MQISLAASIKHATSCLGAADNHAAGPIPQSRSNQKLLIMLYNTQDNALVTNRVYSALISTDIYNMILDTIPAIDLLLITIYHISIL